MMDVSSFALRGQKMVGRSQLFQFIAQQNNKKKNDDDNVYVNVSVI